MSDFLNDMDRAQAERVLMLRDSASGLSAVIALDDFTLGPACGGIRTRAYPHLRDALSDAQRLAAAMTLKCAIAGLPAGGGKTVVLDHPHWDRVSGFRRLGEHIEQLGGLYRAAGDLGTTREDLQNAAKATSYVNTSGARLGEATGAGVVNCMRAVAAERGHDLADLTIAVQGCGLIGAGVSRLLAAAGVHLVLADLDQRVANALARELGARTVDPEHILDVECDIVAPCAIGGVLTVTQVDRLRAWAICGGANNQLEQVAAITRITQRGIFYVPDFLASAGAVIDGIGGELGAGDTEKMILALGETTRAVIEASRCQGVSTVEAAEQIARARIMAARQIRTPSSRSTSKLDP